MRESKAALRDRAGRIAASLADAYPRSQCALRHADPWQLLVATVLSAQTTDVAVNAVTPRLWARWPTARHLADADVDEVARTIDSIGLWRQKAKNIVGLSKVVAAEGVPQEMKALMALPGVGRKTATAVLGTAFGKAVGITVDTHMLRVNRLLGLTKATKPEPVARDLEALLPASEWTSYTHRVIDHGRLVCVARRPRCGVCPVAGDCRSAFSVEAGYKPAHDERVPASAAGLSWKVVQPPP